MILSGGAAGAAAPAYTLQQDEHGSVLKTPDGRTVFRYMTRRPADTKLTANSVCCLFPVKTPAGEDVVEFAPADHPHHRGVFFAWHAVAGSKAADFWGWGEFAPTKDRVITNRSVRRVNAGATHAVIEVRNEWVAEGETMIEETTLITAQLRHGQHVIDLDFRLYATSELTLRQTAFGGFCIRSRKDGTAVYADPRGEVKRANPHHLKPETDWPAAAWYDYTIRLESGKTIGATLLDHPGNPPTRWHNLGPLAMLNPCIVAHGPVELKAGRPLRLRYRLVVHDGPVPTRLLNQLAAEWRRTKPSSKSQR
jgi:hypothetical protein